MGELQITKEEINAQKKFKDVRARISESDTRILLRSYLSTKGFAPSMSHYYMLVKSIFTYIEDEFGTDSSQIIDPKYIKIIYSQFTQDELLFLYIYEPIDDNELGVLMEKYPPSDYVVGKAKKLCHWLN